MSTRHLWDLVFESENWPNRVLVLGAPGSGKSVLSSKLASRLNLPLFHLDHYYWSKNWVPCNPEKFSGICDELSEGEQWILDGNFGTTLKARWAKADLVVFVDTNPWKCILRQIIRSVFNGKDDSRPVGCKERFNGQLFWFTYKFRGAHGRLIQEKMCSDFPNVKFIKVGT